MSLKIGKISGIEIYLNYSWFIVFGLLTWTLAAEYLPHQYPHQPGLFYWVVGVVSAGSLFLSVLVHEVSHSLIAKRNEIAVRRITLHFFGGVSETMEEANSPGKELKMAAAGPLTSLALGLILMACWRIAEPSALIGLRAVFRYAAYTNIGLAMFNMTPAFPLDGGRVLRAFLWMRSGKLLASTRMATKVSKAFSFLFIIFGFTSFLFLPTFNGLWFLVLGLLINSSAEASLNRTMIGKALERVRVEEVMTSEVHTVEPEASIKQLIDNHFIKYKHRGFPVVSGGRLIGMITDHDVRQIPRERWEKVRVSDVMRPVEELVTVDPDDMVMDALLMMAKRDIGRLPVMEGDELVGILTRSDINRTVKMRFDFELGTN